MNYVMTRATACSGPVMLFSGTALLAPIRIGRSSRHAVPFPLKNQFLGCEPWHATGFVAETVILGFYGWLSSGQIGGMDAPMLAEIMEVA